MTHSSIENAAEWCAIALEAPVYAQADYDAILEQLEDAHATLRRVFVGGQDPSVPDDWRIDGIVFRQWDMALERAKTKLLARFKASKFFAGQRRRDKKTKDDSKKVEPRWMEIGSYEAMIRYKQSGFDVKTIYGYPTKYFYASRKN